MVSPQHSATWYSCITFHHVAGNWDHNGTTVATPCHSAPGICHRTAVRRLTATRIEGLAPAAARYELTDPAVAGLQLRIEPTGAKSWILRYYWRGRRVRLSLGTFPGTSQRGAHEAASRARKLLEDGIDPRRAERPTAKRRLASVPADGRAAPTNRHSVENLADEFMRLHIRGAQKRKRPEYVKRVLDVDVLPTWKGR